MARVESRPIADRLRDEVNRIAKRKAESETMRANIAREQAALEAERKDETR